ncbi:hypothetical protein B0H13DRAFT_1905603 [Mycena leptocephala]|nr:hypothetical protein B0H13DRAFT_1905603 [Mycena leptocephala]
MSLSSLSTIYHPHLAHASCHTDAYEYWVCKILYVRAKGVTDVRFVFLARLSISPISTFAGLYSARDAAGMDRKFDASHCGKYERLKSNHVDYISSFSGLVHVKHYDETALGQESIGVDEFTTDRPSISPKNPSLWGSQYWVRRKETQPQNSPHRERPFRDRLNFLLADPDTGAPLQLPLNESASAGPPKKCRRASHAAIPNPSPMALGPLLAALPPALMQAAAQPIVRGGVLGVAGNAAAVVAARCVVYGALQEGTAAEGWEKRMPEGWEKTMPPGWDEEEVVLGEAGADENGVLTPEAKISGSSKHNFNFGPDLGLDTTEERQSDIGRNGSATIDSKNTPETLQQETAHDTRMLGKRANNASSTH